jgi:hypothetical protein
MKHWVGIFMVAMGILMAGMWAFFLLAGMVPELKTVPFTTAAHLAAEFTTAILMVIGGILILKQRLAAVKVALPGLGMYLYAVIQAPGYFIQQGSLAFVVLFTVFILLGIAAILNLTGFLELGKRYNIL